MLKNSRSDFVVQKSYFNVCAFIDVFFLAFNILNTNEQTCIEPVLFKKKLTIYLDEIKEPFI